MRRSSPSIIPGGEPTVYLVVDNLGRLGSVWREVDAEATDYETVFRDLLSGQYSNPVRVVGFNTAEGWSRDVSAEIAEDLQQRCDLENKELPAGLQGIRREPGDEEDRVGGQKPVQVPPAVTTK
jgi:hypothetical protein